MMVAIDGSKFRASNSRLAYNSFYKVEKKIEYYRKAAEHYLSLLENCDRQESDGAKAKLSKDEIEAKVARVSQRLEPVYLQSRGIGEVSGSDEFDMGNLRSTLLLCRRRRRFGRREEDEKFKNHALQREERAC